MPKKEEKKKQKINTKTRKKFKYQQEFNRNTKYVYLPAYCVYI